MPSKSPEALERKRQRQKELRQELRDRMKAEDRVSLRCFVSSELNKMICDKARQDFPEIENKEISLGLVIDKYLNL